MSDYDSSQINQLIADKRYEEAKMLLRQSRDPSARSWLASLDKRFPTNAANTQHLTRTRNSRVRLSRRKEHDPLKNPSLSWSEAWIKALAKPSEASYTEIVNNVSRNSYTAYQWIFVAGTAAFLIQVITTALLVSRNPYSGGYFPITYAFFAPIAGAICVIGFAFSNWIVQTIARALGGTGTYEQLVYIAAAYTAPLLVVTTAFASIVANTYSYILLGAYGSVLNVIALKSVHRFGWGRAILCHIAVLILFVTVLVAARAVFAPNQLNSFQ